MVETSTDRSRDAPLPAPCRFCASPLVLTFVDLGMAPPCQTHIEPYQLNAAEVFYPLHAKICGKCLLVQLEEYVTPGEIFSDYAYFSSYSDSWVAHAKAYTEAIIRRLSLHHESLVMEIASNDGYLLQHFAHAGIPCLGIEPAANVAAVAKDRGIPTLVQFFGLAAAREIARKHGRPDLLLGNNVLAHVPDINDFVSGMKELLAPDGVITMEFPHLQQLIEQCQFDTIYHEHFSYLSFTTAEAIFKYHGLVIFDVERLETHGGSLRIYARHEENQDKCVEPSVAELRGSELAAGMNTLRPYADFAPRVHAVKRNLLDFLNRAKRSGRSVVGYGAPGKGNTLLNYCGIRRDYLDYTVDRSPHKQGRYTPGTRIPILHPDAIGKTKPDFVLILPWNLEREIVEQHAYIGDWGGRFVVPIPEVRVIE